MSMNTLLIAPNPNAAVSAIGGADGPTAILVAESAASSMSSAVEILFQGMASIFVVLGVIAVVVAVLKKLDTKKK